MNCTDNPTIKQANDYLINSAILDCKKSLSSEQCKRFLFANPQHKEKNVKTCSYEEIAQSSEAMVVGARKAIAERYEKKVEEIWPAIQNLTHIRIPTDLDSLTFHVGTVIFDTLGKYANYAQFGFKSIGECLEKNKTCFGKIFALAEAEVEKLKIKTAGFECLKPEVQSSMVALAMMETASLAGITPEDILIQNAATKVVKKLSKDKTPDDNDGEQPNRRHNAEVMVARSPARQAIIDEMNEEKQKEFFATLSPDRFTAHATRDISGSKNSSRRLYFIRENSMLKTMNDETHDFDFVTSLNLFDQINFDHEIDLLLRRPENRDLFSHLNGKDASLKYRDGKTFQGSFSLDGLTNEQEERLVKLINDACTNTLKTATQKFESLHRHDEEQGLQSGLPANLASAFKCGIGYNHISAGHAARKARDESHVAAHELSDFRQYGERAAPLVAKAKQALDRAQKIKSQLPPEDWAKLWNADKGLFSLDVFEALRKSASPQELVGKIKEYTGGVAIDRDQAARLFSYKTSIDALSPTFLDQGAEILSFDEAHFGGLKSDFPNVGARNFEALAEALKDAKAGAKGEGLNDLPQRLKLAEEKVTKSLAEQKEALGVMVKKVFSNVSCMKTSGDDGSTHFGCPVPRSVKQTFINEASKSPLLKNTRFAFFADNVVAADRMGLANHGEFLEKDIRSFLRKENVFSPEELKNLTLAIDLQSERLWQGKIDMIIAGEGNLTPQQKKQLDLAFDMALKKLASENAGQSKYSRANRFYSEKSPTPPLERSPAP